MLSMFSLDQQTAVVTGGTGHLGYAMAEGLSEAGARVIITSRFKDKADQAAVKVSGLSGNECIGLQLDISDRESVKKAFCWLHNNTSGFNILVNNASFSIRGDIELMTDEAWNSGLIGTVSSVFKCMQEALPYMRRFDHSNKAIINIASMYGMVSPNPDIYGDSGYNSPPNYGAGKAGIIQLTKFAACHLAAYGVRVNTISPGPFPSSKVQQNEAFIQELKKKNPLKRIGKPAELKGALVFLASEASSFVTGHNLVVDGGWTAW